MDYSVYVHVREMSWDEISHEMCLLCFIWLSLNIKIVSSSFVLVFRLEDGFLIISFHGFTYNCKTLLT